MMISRKDRSFLPSMPRLAIFAVIPLLCSVFGCQEKPDRATAEQSEADEAVTPEDFAGWQAELEQAQTDAAAGQADVAESKFLKAVELAEGIATHQSNQPLHVSLDALTDFYLAIGRQADAEPYLQRLVRLCENDESVEEVAVAATIAKLGWCQNELQKHAEAKANLNKAYLILRDQCDDPARVLWTLAQLVIANTETNNPSAAYDTLNQLLVVHKEQPEPDHNAIAHVLCSLTDFALQLEKPNEAFQWIKSADELATKNPLEAAASHVVARTGLNYANVTGNRRAVEYFQSKMSSSQQGNGQPDHHSEVRYSVAKQEAYEDMVAAERECLLAKQRCDADMSRYRAQSQMASQNAGRLGALGVDPIYVIPDPPDQHLQMEMLQAEQAYRQARMRFEQTR